MAGHTKHQEMNLDREVETSLHMDRDYMLVAFRLEFDNRVGFLLMALSLNVTKKRIFVVENLKQVGEDTLFLSSGKLNLGDVCIQAQGLNNGWFFLITALFWTECVVTETESQSVYVTILVELIKHMSNSHSL